MTDYVVFRLSMGSLPEMYVGSERLKILNGSMWFNCANDTCFSFTITV